MRRFILICIISSSALLLGQSVDSIRVYWMDPIEVTALRQEMGQMNIDISRDVITRNLNDYGFSTIHKGVFFAQDLYADGFKKGDINVVIDGERYPNACPNRMDSPVTRVNPLDIVSADLMKTSSSTYSGLGGMVQFHRSVPGQDWKGHASISQTGGSLLSTDLAGIVEGINNKISLRYATGKPYESGDGSTFTDLYNYKTNDDSYQLGELYLQGKKDNFSYGAGLSITRDIHFPYLKMDERTNDLYNLFFKYDGHKVYANYTSHLMDNELRTDNMSMISDATNYIIGITGDDYDLYYRNWNVDNNFNKPTVLHIDNHMIPDLRHVGFNYNRKYKAGAFNFSGKVGMQFIWMGDKERLSFNQALFPDAESSRFFLNFGLGASYEKAVWQNASIGGMVEVASENPDIEYLYIGVQKPAGKVWWAGNPTLEAPVRLTGRLGYAQSGLNIEAFVANIWNYVSLANTVADSQKYTTYTNINAFMTGINLKGTWEFFEFNANYTWALNRTGNLPLAEVPPLNLAAKIKSPLFYGIKAAFTIRHQSAQDRVDETLGELPSESWYTLGLDIDYRIDNFRVSLTVDNISNENYYQHLSYQRDPFQSGSRVYEPGIVLRLNVIYMGS